MKITIVLSVVLLILVALIVRDQMVPRTETIQPTIFQAELPSPTPSIQIAQPNAIAIIAQRTHVLQSFNNCGPASLSMLLSYFNIQASQEELGQKLRPYQNPQGDNDDKSVTLAELANESKNYNLIPYHRPNGTLDLLKLFIANDLPVVVRTWLHENEDIGHYRVLRGYDDTTQEIIQDDSYEGKDLRFSYEKFLRLWQPYNYEYLVVVPQDKERLVQAILKTEIDEKIAWENALTKAQQESMATPTNIYPIFNQSVALYHLGNYTESLQHFESIQSQLPPRMLWYQLEPIQAYLQLNNYQKVFELTDSILNSQNRAYSELYLLRGQAYEKQGNTQAAQLEYEKAVFYNQNLVSAQQALQSVSQ